MENPLDMSREALQKALEKAQRDWQETLERMTPAERAQAEAKAKAAVEADWAAQQDLLDRVNAITGGAAPAQRTMPKFCMNCGAQVAGGKFCTNCGSPLQ